jgi:hypothetical protein
VVYLRHGIVLPAKIITAYKFKTSSRAIETHIAVPIFASFEKQNGKSDVFTKSICKNAPGCPASNDYYIVRAVHYSMKIENASTIFVKESAYIYACFEYLATTCNLVHYASEVSEGGIFGRVCGVIEGVGKRDNTLKQRANECTGVERSTSGT